jgi:cation:H+ antiporter
MIPVLLLAAGLVALVAGAELLVKGASALARAFGISPLVIGLTVVAFGTSSPELAVSVQSAWAGKVDIALGNVVGSNIFNVLFILGLSAMVAPLTVARQVVRQEVPVMIAVSLLLFGLAFDRGIGRLDGALLAGGLIVYTLFLLRQSRREVRNGGAEALAADRTWRRTATDAAVILAGLVLLVVGSNWLVDGAVAIARSLGVSDMIVGLTIIAAGTSLPEVATSVTATVRGERDIAVGNVVGSNVFNIMGVLGISALVAPASLAVPPAMLTFDMLVMIAVAVACLPVFFTSSRISRWEGGVFLAYYAAYTAYLVMAAADHDALDEYGFVMMAFVIPLTALTLAIAVWRKLRGG